MGKKKNGGSTGSVHPLPPLPSGRQWRKFRWGATGWLWAAASGSTGPQGPRGRLALLRRNSESRSLSLAMGGMVSWGVPYPSFGASSSPSP
jgi:hypothetical protein